MSDEPADDDTVKSHRKTRKINGILIFGLIIFVTFIASYRPDIPSVKCSDEILATRPEVILFGTWWCPYCYQARRYLHSNDVSYCEYDIEKSVIGKQLYDEMNATAIPAMIIGRYVLQGFNETRIDEALARSRENDEAIH